MELGGRIGIAGLDDGEVFLQGIYDQREYDPPIDNQGLGFQRSSQGYQLAIGYNGMIGPMRGEVLLGLISQSYDDPRFGTTTALVFGADLSMPLDARTDLDAFIERNLEETTISGASEYISIKPGHSMSGSPVDRSTARILLSDSAEQAALGWLGLTKTFQFCGIPRDAENFIFYKGLINITKFITQINY